MIPNSQFQYNLVSLYKDLLAIYTSFCWSCGSSYYLNFILLYVSLHFTFLRKLWVYSTVLNMAMWNYYYHPPKDRGRILFWRCPSVWSLSVHPSRFSVRTHILVTDFQILLSPAEDLRGILFWRCLWILPLYVRQAGYGLRKVDQRCIVKSLASFHWPSVKAVSCCKDLSKALVMAPR